MEDGGRGPVDPGAHFYRSFQMDGEGNPINKRNAWQTRSVLYVRLIPPGAADTVHFRVRDSERCGGAGDARGQAELSQVFELLHEVGIRGRGEAGLGGVWTTTAASTRSTRAGSRSADRHVGAAPLDNSNWASRIGSP